MSLRAWWRQPIVGFIAAGALVFGADRWLHRDSGALVLDDATRAELARGLESELGRLPSTEELGAAESKWFDEEALLREALKLGLDRDDSVIRNHLINKLRHVVRERTLTEAPTEAELRSIYAANPTKYSQPITYDISHVFILNPDAKEVSPRAAQLLSQLAAGAEAAGLGDHFPRGSHFTELTREQLEAILDLKLGAVLQPSELKKWVALVGPRGTHLVRLNGIAGPEMDPVALRSMLSADFLEQKKAESLQKFTQELRKTYPGVERKASK